MEVIQLLLVVVVVAQCHRALAETAAIVQHLARPPLAVAVAVLLPKGTVQSQMVYPVVPVAVAQTAPDLLSVVLAVLAQQAKAMPAVVVVVALRGPAVVVVAQEVRVNQIQTLIQGVQVVLASNHSLAAQGCFTPAAAAAAAVLT
jgi:hypothetical protein